MQDLLKDYLVEYVGEKTKNYSLTCAVCGAVWLSESTPISRDRGCDLEAEISAVEEAKKYNRMCTFCGRPVCLKCFEDVEGIFLCTQCGELLRQRIHAI